MGIQTLQPHRHGSPRAPRQLSFRGVVLICSLLGCAQFWLGVAWLLGGRR